MKTVITSLLLGFPWGSEPAREGVRNDALA
ncbi:Uncharacterised protein [Pseudomonas fluorescens]|uniref:Uncharacterized protein n=1 Tax=Pseudomonas fluorescens TaxID=294 RepID=A0A448E1V3_PSEFL|nr:Uncharacterised protein [Pseudomonas fluorescens]